MKKSLIVLSTLTGLLVLGSIVHKNTPVQNSVVKDIRSELEINISNTIQSGNRFLVASGKEAYLKTTEDKNFTTFAVLLEKILLDRLPNVPDAATRVVISQISHNFASEMMKIDTLDYNKAVKGAVRGIISVPVVLGYSGDTLIEGRFLGNIINESEVLLNILN